MRTTTTLLLVLTLAGCDGCENGLFGGKLIELSDANNFSYIGDIDAPSHEVASGVNIEICWDGLTSDIQCHEVDPTADPGIVTMARFSSLTEIEVEEQISNDTLPQSALSGFLSYEIPAGESCAQLEDFTLEGTPVVLDEQFYEGGGTYLLLVGAGTEPGQNTLSMDFMAPLESSELTELTIDDACATLDFSADLASLETIAPKASGSSWVVDWGGLSVTGLGNPITLSKLDRLMLGHYADLSVADLEESFLDLELIASELYYLDIAGELDAELANATGDDGDFTGFTEGGTWVLALMCTSCSNPAPLFLTVVEPS
jgi:hypothetical protein